MNNLKTAKGFTMIELIIVITIMGIISTSAIINFGNMVNRFEVEEQTEKMASVIRYARDYAGSREKFCLMEINPVDGTFSFNTAELEVEKIERLPEEPAENHDLNNYRCYGVACQESCVWGWLSRRRRNRCHGWYANLSHAAEVINRGGKIRNQWTRKNIDEPWEGDASSGPFYSGGFGLPDGDSTWYELLQEWKAYDRGGIQYEYVTTLVLGDEIVLPGESLATISLPTDIIFNYTGPDLFYPTAIEGFEEGDYILFDTDGKPENGSGVLTFRQGDVLKIINIDDLGRVGIYGEGNYNDNVMKGTHEIFIDDILMHTTLKITRSAALIDCEGQWNDNSDSKVVCLWNEEVIFSFIPEMPEMDDF